MKNYFQWKIKKIIHYGKRNRLSDIISIIRLTFLSKINRFYKLIINRFTSNKREIEFKKILNGHQYLKSSFRITLLVSTFFDAEGCIFLQGGAERYIIELNRIIKAMGGRLIVFQCGAANWYKNIHDVDVFGLDTGGVNIAELNRVFHQWIEPGDITIYFQMLLSAPKCNHPSVCISHGIDWDAHWLQANAVRYKKTIQQVFRSMINVSKVISVDTNTINWIRATDSKLAEKCLYIPNFVDRSKFFFSPKHNEDIIVLYPRRLSEARGFWLLSRNVPSLIKKYPDIQIHFCGKAEPFEEDEILKLCDKYIHNVKWFDVPPDQMVEVYQSAEIVVIPTFYSEGTSLSLLEAMACKKPVIVTNVGGLTDLILPGYNGIQISPTTEELYRAICLLVDNPRLREYISSNALHTSQVFDKSIWVNKWQQIINSFLPPPVQDE